MKPKFLLCFLSVLLTVLHLQIVKSHRLTSKQMLLVLKELKNMTDLTDSSETKKCLPFIEGNLYSDVSFLFMSCDTNPKAVTWRDRDIYGKCPGYQCWESHMTDSTRFGILDVMNTYRTLVAEGTCGPRCEKNNQRLVFELRWCRDLEHEAVNRQSKFCLENSKPVSIQPRTDWKWLDNVTVTFQVKEGFQRELRLILRTLLAENHLNDWNKKTNQFRRGLAVEVGCAYLLKYGVTMETTLNEFVNAGNVGHFSCIFGSSLPFDTYQSDSKPSNVSCATALPGLPAILPSNDYLYRSLCTVTWFVNSITEPKINCQLDKEYSKKIFDIICPGETFQNPETWEEKWFGLFLRFRSKFEKNKFESELQSVECNVPVLPEPFFAEEGDYHNYNCTREYEVANNANPSACQGWNCEESQLTDMVRHLIWHTLNKAVEMVAQGVCTTLCKPPCVCNWIQYCNVAERRWHWYLELEATKRVNDCPSENSLRKVNFPHSPFLEPVTFEEVTVVFHLHPEGQDSLHDRFADLFWSNALHDWDENGLFRRANAMWIGCSIVIRSQQTNINIRPEFRVHNGVPTHMVCIYAALEKNFYSIQGPANKNCCLSCTEPVRDVVCRVQTAKNKPPHPHLCSSSKSLNIAMSCAVNKCHAPLKEWMALSRKVPGFTLIRYVNGSFEYVYRPLAAETRAAFISSKICSIATLLFGIAIVMALLVISLIYKHNEEKTYYKKAKLQRNENLKESQLK